MLGRKIRNPLPTQFKSFSPLEKFVGLSEYLSGSDNRENQTSGFGRARLYLVAQTGNCGIMVNAI